MEEGNPSAQAIVTMLVSYVNTGEDIISRAKNHKIAGSFDQMVYEWVSASYYFMARYIGMTGPESVFLDMIRVVLDGWKYKKESSLADIYRVMGILRAVHGSCFFGVQPSAGVSSDAERLLASIKNRNSLVSVVSKEIQDQGGYAGPEKGD